MLVTAKRWLRPSTLCPLCCMNRLHPCWAFFVLTIQTARPAWVWLWASFSVLPGRNGGCDAARTFVGLGCAACGVLDTHLLCCTQEACLVGQWAAANIAKNKGLLVLGVSHERVLRAKLQEIALKYLAIQF